MNASYSNLLHQDLDWEEALCLAEQLVTEASIAKQFGFFNKKVGQIRVLFNIKPNLHIPKRKSEEDVKPLKKIKINHPHSSKSYQIARKLSESDIEENSNEDCSEDDITSYSSDASDDIIPNQIPKRKLFSEDVNKDSNGSHKKLKK